MARLYDRGQWRTRRVVFLREHPYCVKCLTQGKVVPATAVDHIRPHDNNEELFFDETNWQGLCEKHHNQKTAHRDGGFGNRVLPANEVRPLPGCDVRGIPTDKNHHWHQKKKS